jgi:hypothetical protein
MYEQNLPPYLAHDLAAINALIDDTPLLTDLQRQFYKTYLAARYEVLFERGCE